MLETIDSVIDNWMTDVMTCLPAKVIRKYEGEARVDVSPAIDLIWEDGETAKRSDIYGVPLLYSRSATSQIYFPVKVGDSVLLIFSQRGLDNYKQNGSSTPHSLRMFNVNDAIAIPTVLQFDKPLDIADENNLVIQHNISKANQSTIRMKEDGGVDILCPNGALNIQAASINIVSTSPTVIDGVIVKTHVHGGVTSGGGSTLPPTI